MPFNVEQGIWKMHVVSSALEKTRLLNAVLKGAAAEKRGVLILGFCWLCGENEICW